MLFVTYDYVLCLSTRLHYGYHSTYQNPEISLILAILQFLFTVCRKGGEGSRMSEELRQHWVDCHYGVYNGEDPNVWDSSLWRSICFVIFDMWNVLIIVFLHQKIWLCVIQLLSFLVTLLSISISDVYSLLIQLFSSRELLLPTSV